MAEMEQTDGIAPLNIITADTDDTPSTPTATTSISSFTASSAAPTTPPAASTTIDAPPSSTTTATVTATVTATATATDIATATHTSTADTTSNVSIAPADAPATPTATLDTPAPTAAIDTPAPAANMEVPTTPASAAPLVATPTPSSPASPASPDMLEHKTPDPVPMAVPISPGSAKQPRTKNTQARLSGFTLGVTWALQKLGKYNKTAESAEFEATVKQFQANRTGLAELLRWATEIAKNNKTVALTNREFYSSLGKLGGANKDKEAAETVQAFVPLALDLEVIRQRFDVKLHTLLLEPLRDLENHIQSVLRFLSKLEVDRLDMDTKLQQEIEYANKDPNDFGKVASQERAAEAKLTYNKTLMAITDLCALIESSKKHLLQENLLEFTRAQAEYFEACAHRSVRKMSQVSQSPPASPR